MNQKMFSNFITKFASYDTGKRVEVNNRFVGIVRRVIQLAIIFYVLIYVLIYKRGYQATSYGTYTNVIKVKGAIKTNQNEIYDVLDLIQPVKDKDGIFITTSIVEYLNQHQDSCFDTESPCSEDADCVKNNLSSNDLGILNGKCVKGGKSTKTLCQYEGWCSESNNPPVKPIYNNLQDFSKVTIFLKSYVFFEAFNAKFVNIPSKMTPDILKKCRYDSTSEVNRTCPIFFVDQILFQTKVDVNQLVKQGGVIAIYVDWMCNLDWSLTDCEPNYRWEQINPDSATSPGYNFRMVKRYFSENGTNYRDAQKLYGLQFVISTSVLAKKFDFIVLFINLGSGLGLMGICGVVCDWLLLHIIPHHQEYKGMIYSARNKEEPILNSTSFAKLREASQSQ